MTIQISSKISKSGSELYYVDGKRTGQQKINLMLANNTDATVQTDDLYTAQDFAAITHGFVKKVVINFAELTLMTAAAAEEFGMKLVRRYVTSIPDLYVVEQPVDDREDDDSNDDTDGDFLTDVDETFKTLPAPESLREVNVDEPACAAVKAVDASENIAVDEFSAKESELKENISFAIDGLAYTCAELVDAKKNYDFWLWQAKLAEEAKIKAELDYNNHVFGEAARLNTLPLVDALCNARDLCLTVVFDVKTQLFKIEHGIAAVAGAKITLGAFKTPAQVESFMQSLLPSDNDTPPVDDREDDGSNDDVDSDFLADIDETFKTLPAPESLREVNVDEPACAAVPNDAVILAERMRAMKEYVEFKTAADILREDCNRALAARDRAPKNSDKQRRISSFISRMTPPVRAFWKKYFDARDRYMKACLVLTAAERAAYDAINPAPARVEVFTPPAKTPKPAPVKIKAPTLPVIIPKDLPAADEISPDVITLDGLRRIMPREASIIDAMLTDVARMTAAC